MFKLANSEKFSREYRNYKNSIEKISNGAAREKGLTLLAKLKSETVIIDECHSSRNSKTIDPRTVRDNIRRIVEIRIELDQLIKDAR